MAIGKGFILMEPINGTYAGYFEGDVLVTGVINGLFEVQLGSSLDVKQ
jgi:hypothetical protein